MGCGICGFVGLSDSVLLKSMCGTLTHRGPDETGYYTDKDVGLGIDRLRIIDLVSGQQPIHNEDSTVWLVFNGEIYNYIELRKELEQKGHSFYTNSDSETIVHAYEEWGEDSVGKLRGMFAFAIWDTKRKRLFLARDRFGKKPLFYSRWKGSLLFASEPKAILKLEELPRSIDMDAVDFFFSYGYIPSPMTIFREIRKLPPGHWAVFERGRLSTQRYWDMEFKADRTKSESAAVEDLFRVLREAVRIRLRSDVPVGAFLSGGIDSSSVVSIMSSLSSTPVRTVSIGFTEGVSELRYAKKVAEFLSTDHREYVISPDVYSILPALIHNFDEPFADHSMIPTYYVSEKVRENVTVALSGDGGDEMFMGYPFLIEPRVFGLYSRVPKSVRRAALKCLVMSPFDFRGRRMARHALEKGYGDQPEGERLAMRLSMFDSEGLAGLFAKSQRKHLDPYTYVAELWNASSSSDPYDRACYSTIHSYLEEDILTKVDRMSMAVSLEVRCPLLDQELAEYAGTLPSSMKIRGREHKYILKKMAMEKRLLPRDIVYRKKQGFGVPLESWLRKDWKDFTSQALDPVVARGYTGIFDRERVRRLMGDPYLHSNTLFALIAFVIWYGQYIEGAPVASGRHALVAS